MLFLKTNKLPGKKGKTDFVKKNDEIFDTNVHFKDLKRIVYPAEDL